MSKNKRQSSWLQRFTVKAKIRSPIGVTLTTGETIALADIYEDDVKQLKKNEQQVLSAVGATHLDVARSIEKSVAAKNNAAGIYKRTKDPIKKREWARRLVVADTAVKTLRGMKTRVEATHDRLEMIKGDLELQIMEAEAKAAEAKAYAKAGSQLRLVGEKLLDARTRAGNVKLEYTNLEINMEEAERTIDRRSVENLLSEADRIAARLPKETQGGKTL